MTHHPEPEPYPALRARAIESLLVEKGLISTDAIDALVDLFEKDIGPLRGARVVARAWIDPDFKARLLADANTACEELAIPGLRTRLVVLENTPAVAQHGRVHTVLVLPVVGFGIAAQLVQVGGVPFPSGH